MLTIQRPAYLVIRFFVAAIIVQSIKADPLPEPWQSKREAVNRITDKACSGDESAISEVHRRLADNDPVMMNNTAWLSDNCDSFKTLTALETSAYQMLSALAGYPIAMSNYGQLLITGERDNKRDASKGLAFMEKAIDAGYGGAAVRLAELYVEGEWLPCDLEKSRAYLFMAKGEDVSPDKVKSLEELIAKAEEKKDRTVLIPAATFSGTFSMGDNFKEGRENELPVHSVYVSDFYIARTETTYRRWKHVGDWAVNNGYSFESHGEASGTDHPVHSVTWYDVVKWCNAASELHGLEPVYRLSDGSVYRTGRLEPLIEYDNRGYRLPTEAEWEKAARGGLSGKRFPWGNEINHRHANFLSMGNKSESYDTNSYDKDTWTFHPITRHSFSMTAPVGSFAANGYGLYDMAGNLSEWCGDWSVREGGYSSSSPVIDPTGPSSDDQDFRVVRGGSWRSSAFACRTAFRHSAQPGARIENLGFRVARTR